MDAYFIQNTLPQNIYMRYFWSVFQCCIIVSFLVFNTSCQSKKEGQESSISTEVADSLNIKNDNNPTGIDLSFLKTEHAAYYVPWQYFTSISFQQVYSENLEMDVSLPIFNDTLQVLDGKDIVVDGFYIPVDETGDDKIVILSAYPFSQCFFCGKAGVESIIDVMPKTKLPTLKVDTKLRFKGKLKLNKDDFDFLIYILENAELVEQL